MAEHVRSDTLPYETDPSHAQRCGPHTDGAGRRPRSRSFGEGAERGLGEHPRVTPGQGALERLRTLTEQLLEGAALPGDAAAAVRELESLFSELAAFGVPTENIAEGESRLSTGLAISPGQAAMCLRDFGRTTAFLRGVHRAIASCAQAAPGRTVEVLYAGCGPYALLAVPILAIHPLGEVRFTLLDVHERSLRAARALVESLGLEAGVTAYVQADASGYRIPPERAPHVVLAEAMNACLEKEPQVAIARNLLGQAPEALMIPEEVSVEAGLIDLSKEHVFVDAGHTGPIPEPERDRVRLGTVFTLDRANIAAWKHRRGSTLPAGEIELPLGVPDRYRPMLWTRITIFEDVVLEDYDSSLTLPKPMPSSGAASGDGHLRFRYQLGASPGLAC